MQARRDSKKSTIKKIINEEDIMLQGKINIAFLKRQLAHQQKIQSEFLNKLVARFTKLIEVEPNLIDITSPVVIIGDIHGQFYDLLKIFSTIQTELQTRKIIFLGDYVDRGINSVEVMILLMALKIQYPKNIILLRGNHESRVMTQQYNFFKQCCTKYNQKFYQSVVESFDYLPIACVVDKMYFCVHGGISDKMMKIEDINKIDRKIEIPLEDDPFCDFIWADPAEDEKGVLQRRVVYNDSRECSIFYGATLTNEFFLKNKITSIIRGHQVFLEGYKAHNWKKDPKEPPSVMTVFSAPNYCGVTANKGAVLWLQNNKMKIRQQREQHPENLKFLVGFEAFSWTYPHLMKNASQVVSELMNRLVKFYVPQLEKEPQEKKIYAFLDYAYKQSKVKDYLNKKFDPKDIYAEKKLTPEEEREALFNRSQDYFANSEKAPRKH